jgi:hypothetical protein
MFQALLRENSVGFPKFIKKFTQRLSGKMQMLGMVPKILAEKLFFMLNCFP